MATTQGQSWSIFIYVQNSSLDCCINAPTWVDGICLKSRWRRDRREVFLSSFFDPLCRGSLGKVCVDGGDTNQFYTIPTKVSLFHSLVPLSCFHKQPMPVVGWRLCRIHADATTCNQQLCLFCCLFHMWGSPWWKSLVHSLESWQRLECPVLLSFSIWLQTRLATDIFFFFLANARSMLKK